MGSRIFTDLLLREYCLVHLAIYLLIFILVGVISFLIQKYHVSKKRIVDSRLNSSLSLTIASITTCLIIPIVTFVIQYDYYLVYGNPHSTGDLDVGLVNLYTFYLPIVLYLILSVIFALWYNNLKRKTNREFFRNYTAKSDKNTLNRFYQ
ncbi:MAG: hypothetical protein ACFFDW_04675 [Candidatus Thorarchaeota archaeon]